MVVVVVVVDDDDVIVAMMVKIMLEDDVSRCPLGRNPSQVLSGKTCGCAPLDFNRPLSNSLRTFSALLTSSRKPQEMKTTTHRTRHPSR